MNRKIGLGFTSKGVDSKSLAKVDVRTFHYFWKTATVSKTITVRVLGPCPILFTKITTDILMEYWFTKETYPEFLFRNYHFYYYRTFLHNLRIWKLFSQVLRAMDLKIQYLNIKYLIWYGWWSRVNEFRDGNHCSHYNATIRRNGLIEAKTGFPVTFADTRNW